MAWCRPYGIPGGSGFCHECYFKNGCDKLPEIRDRKLCNYCAKKLAKPKEPKTIMQIIKEVRKNAH